MILMEFQVQRGIVKKDRASPLPKRQFPSFSIQLKLVHKSSVCSSVPLRDVLNPLVVPLQESLSTQPYRSTSDRQIYYCQLVYWHADPINDNRALLSTQLLSASARICVYGQLRMLTINLISNTILAQSLCARLTRLKRLTERFG